MKLVYALTGSAFLAFWQTTYRQYWIFTDAQWVLIGAGLLTAAGLLLFRRHVDRP